MNCDNHFHDVSTWFVYSLGCLVACALIVGCLIGLWLLICKLGTSVRQALQLTFVTVRAGMEAQEGLKDRYGHQRLLAITLHHCDRCELRDLFADAERHLGTTEDGSIAMWNMRLNDEVYKFRNELQESGNVILYLTGELPLPENWFIIRVEDGRHFTAVRGDDRWHVRGPLAYHDMDLSFATVRQILPKPESAA